MQRALSRLWSAALLVGGFFVLVGYQNCGQAPAATNGPSANSQGAQITFSGTVQKSNVENCNYLISTVDPVTGESLQYIPVGLDQNLMQDGIVVNVSGSVVTDEASTCMAGPLLQVTTAQQVASQ